MEFNENIEFIQFALLYNHCSMPLQYVQCALCTCDSPEQQMFLRKEHYTT